MKCDICGGELEVVDVLEFSEEGIISETVNTIWTGTEEQYEALTPKTDTLYFIEGE